MENDKKKLYQEWPRYHTLRCTQTPKCFGVSNYLDEKSVSPEAVLSSRLDENDAKRPPEFLENWREIPFTAFSNYSGGTLERANFRAFLQDFGEIDGVSELVFSFGGSAVIVVEKILCENDEMREVLENLSNYPCISDDTLYEIEQELEIEAWNDFGADEFKKAIEEDLRVKLEYKNKRASYHSQELFSKYSENGAEFETGGLVFFRFDFIGKITIGDVFDVFQKVA